MVLSVCLFFGGGVQFGIMCQVFHPNGKSILWLKCWDNASICFKCGPVSQQRNRKWRSDQRITEVSWCEWRNDTIQRQCGMERTREFKRKIIQVVMWRKIEQKQKIIIVEYWSWPGIADVCSMVGRSCTYYQKAIFLKIYFRLWLWALCYLQHMDRIADNFFDWNLVLQFSLHWLYIN